MPTLRGENYVTISRPPVTQPTVPHGMFGAVLWNGIAPSVGQGDGPFEIECMCNVPSGPLGARPHMCCAGGSPPPPNGVGPNQVQPNRGSGRAQKNWLENIKKSKMLFARARLSRSGPGATSKGIWTKKPKGEVATTLLVHFAPK